ncbi:efflux RND transporter periplasmic adaptor subunit [Tautonia sociabilis]|uniref:Efflux RND transporter periplasmic adaptor subunit n=1 Tax=Tautonia sociabilis TaxID=2080755 RepID=A0A432MNL5_9BACT|nr:efflux RND transporter periplasmic adaptor subunit [Tautonia sociabilis]RUL89002.1 efflux RND transporter periplasmic adaptor subunit [Tautonia sociabilis]
MKTRTTKRRIPWLAGLLMTAGAAGAAAFLLPSASWSSDAKALLEGVARVPVVRTDLAVTVTATGEVNSASNTLIECELQQLQERSAGGQRIGTSGRSMIIEIIPEGSVVKKGDVLCRIDGSEYEEMIRQKIIENEQEGSELKQAELELENARISLTEFLEGTRIQQIQQYEGQIKLAEAQLQRQKDRVAWAERMLPLGYISQARYEQEKQLLLSDQIALDRVQEALANYERYTVPKTVQTLESQIARRLSTVTYMRRRAERNEERLREYQEQLTNCTIRAPHDGYVIYAQDDDDPPLAVGVAVHQHMDLFHLPDLGNMQVEVGLNETIVERVAAGQPATVRVVAFPGVELKGRVLKVEQLPRTTRYSWIKDDVKEYRAVIAMESYPGLMPKMEAEVEILTDERPGALVVPARAIAYEGGDPYCLVARGEGGIERRVVDVRPGTIDLLHVLGGLDEGEQVVLDPTRPELEELVVEHRLPLITHDSSDAGSAQASAGSALLQ